MVVRTMDQHKEREKLRYPKHIPTFRVLDFVKLLSKKEREREKREKTSFFVFLFGCQKKSKRKALLLLLLL